MATCLDGATRLSQTVIAGQSFTNLEATNVTFRGWEFQVAPEGGQ